MKDIAGFLFVGSVGGFALALMAMVLQLCFDVMESRIPLKIAGVCWCLIVISFAGMLFA